MKEKELVIINRYGGKMKDSQRKAMFAKINMDNVNQTTVDEIVLGATSDGEFYRKIINPNASSLEKRMRGGRFEKDFALKKKGFLDRIGKEAINTYEKEYGHVSNPMRINPDERRAIGKEIIEDKIIAGAREGLQLDKLKTDKGKALIKKDISTKEENELIRKGMVGLR